MSGAHRTGDDGQPLPPTTVRHHVVATAGHVDHGKSALVRALTGMEPDRYAEEKRRGMTIDLGFVWTTLDPPAGATGADGRHRSHLAPEASVAFVDVPGHERFVSTMLAGVGPVPVVLLVVAADEGWMPQSAEHVAALHALGVRRGVVAISRSDLADPGPARASVQRHLATTSLAGLPIVSVSSVTGAGLDELRAQLSLVLDGLDEPDAAADVRLWVDRSFTVAGAGTVVTGTLPAGTLRVGDELDLHTADGSRRVAVRGLQSLGRAQRRVTGVARVAVNLRGVRPDEVRRGDALTAASTVTSTELVDVRLHRAAAGGRVAPGEPLAAQCLVHLGSAQVAAAARPLGDETTRLRLARRLPVRRGDRLLLRDPGQHLVLGSGIVLDPSPPALTRRGDARRRSLVLASVPDEPDAGEELRRRGAVTARALRALGLPADAVAGLRAVRAPGGWMVDEKESFRLRAQLLALAEEHARSHPLEPGLSLEEARQHLGLPDVGLIHALFETAGAADGLVIGQGRVSVRGDEDGDLPASVAAAVDAVRRDLAQRPFLAPDAARLADLGLDRQSLGAAVRAGLLDRVGADVFLLPDWAERATHALAALGRPFTVSEARQALDTTRRVAVPLLERLDAERVTRRLPDDRREVR